MATYASPPKMQNYEHVDFWEQATGKRERVGDTGKIRVLTRDICVFKKVHARQTKEDRDEWIDAPVVANLIIPAGTRVHITEYKCRAEIAKVHSMFRLKSQKPIASAYSEWDPDFRYRTGRSVKPDGFSGSGAGCCARGVHFFIDINDALDY